MIKNFNHSRDRENKKEMKTNEKVQITVGRKYPESFKM